MSKKLYAIGFEKVKTFAQEHKSHFRATLNDTSSTHVMAVFGKSHYELAILDFFKSHSILKNPSYAMRLLEYFKSSDFIIQTLQHSGLYTLLTLSEKKGANVNDLLVRYFYACCHLLHEKFKNDEINRALFYLNFIHHAAQVQAKSGIEKNPEAMAKHLLKPKIPKESFGESEEGAFFKLILDSVSVVEQKGKSIKTLRKKSYAILLKMILDGKIAS